MDPIKGTFIKTTEIFLLYPLTTIMNYQIINSNNIFNSFKNIYKTHGFYKGVGFKLLYLPINRFIDLKILQTYDSSLKSALLSSTIKIITYPLQTYSIYYQLNNIKPKMNILFNGYRYFYLYNTLSYYIWFKSLNVYSNNINIKNKILKNGIIGIISSITVDICIHPLKLIQTNLQNNTINRNIFSGIRMKLFISAFQGLFFNILINF